MSKRVYVRIDNRLLHGQVVQFWIPHLNVEKLIVADDEVSANESMRTIYRLALPTHVALEVMPVEQLAGAFGELGAVTTLVLVRTIEAAKRALILGCKFTEIMIGNVHASPERKRVTDAVYLTDKEQEDLCWIKKQGVEIEIQTFPGEVLRLVFDNGGCKWQRC